MITHPSQVCSNCRAPALGTDEATGQPLCLVCARAALHPLTGRNLSSCERCHRTVDILVAIDHDQPRYCLDCQIDILARRVLRPSAGVAASAAGARESLDAGRLAIDFEAARG